MTLLYLERRFSDIVVLGEEAVTSLCLERRFSGIVVLGEGA